MYVVVVSDRLSVTRWYCIETTRWIEPLLEIKLLPPSLKLCYKEIWVPAEIRLLSSGTLLQTLDLENSATAILVDCATCVVVQQF